MSALYATIGAAQLVKRRQVNINKCSIGQPLEEICVIQKIGLLTDPIAGTKREDEQTKTRLDSIVVGGKSTTIKPQQRELRQRKACPTLVATGTCRLIYNIHPYNRWNCVPK
jgi:hypothetical protein